jgi:hypothetical protein
MIPGRPIQAVIFDLDGTLFDSLPLVLRAFQHALEPFGGRPTMETFAALGGPPEKIFPMLISDPQHVPEAMVRLRQFHADHPELIQLFPGALDLLNELRRQQMKLAIWTGRDRASTLPLLAVHGLEDFFSAMVCGDDFTSHKPDPTGLREILRILAVEPAHTLFMGDADVDVIGGAHLSVDTLLITHGRAPAAEIERRAAAMVAAPAEAYAWVRQRLQSAAGS